MQLSESPLSGVGVRIEATGARELDQLPPGWLRQRALEHRLVVLRGFRPPSPDDLVALGRAFEPGGSRLLEWASGPIMDVRIDENAASYLFSREQVPLHWDGFFDREPSFLIWHCVQAPRRGGATVFSDAVAAWELADDRVRAVWQRTRLTYATEKKAHYGGVVTLPLVGRHPVSGRVTLRYAEPVATALAPLSVSDPDGGDLASMVADLAARLYDPRLCHQHVWRDGDVVIADNHALLHGRTAVQDSSPRHLRRVQVL